MTRDSSKKSRKNQTYCALQKVFKRKDLRTTKKRIKKMVVGPIATYGTASWTLILTDTNLLQRSSVPSAQMRNKRSKGAVKEVEKRRIRRLVRAFLWRPYNTYRNKEDKRTKRL